MSLGTWILYFQGIHFIKIVMLERCYTWMLPIWLILCGLEPAYKWIVLFFMNSIGWSFLSNLFVFSSIFMVHYSLPYLYIIVMNSLFSMISLFSHGRLSEICFKLTFPYLCWYIQFPSRLAAPLVYTLILRRMWLTSLGDFNLSKIEDYALKLCVLCWLLL